MAIPERILRNLENLPCCRVDINRYRNLSIGLGEKVKNNCKDSRVEYYGKWEIGTYSAAWRIIKGGEFISGSKMLFENTDIETQGLVPLFEETLLSITELNEYDIRLKFSGNLIVDFFNCSSDDEFLHILNTDGSFWVLHFSGQWINGKSPVRRLR
ncbi:MAG: hypothetical protein LBU19_07200, partial [Treponema sp.]|nr:hypothetical protein [Treponema sp.]